MRLRSFSNVPVSKEDHQPERAQNLSVGQSPMHLDSWLCIVQDDFIHMLLWTRKWPTSSGKQTAPSFRHLIPLGTSQNAGTHHSSVSKKLHLPHFLQSLYMREWSILKERFTWQFWKANCQCVWKIWMKSTILVGGKKKKLRLLKINK